MDNARKLETEPSHTYDSTPSLGCKDGEIHASQNSQTASDYIDSQLQLEADAREALPFVFDRCTQPLGPLRQNLFACLTCNPPSELPSDPFIPAAVCYSCSIACHGEHNLVELFNRRNFICDCGTTRLPSTSPCTLRIDPATGTKGLLHSQTTAEGNKYNQNCRNRFCGCGEEYDAHKEKGTMFQCLGLADEQDGGCGEDWWHSECIMGLPRSRAQDKAESGKEDGKDFEEGADVDADDPLPPGFPHEDDFETFICYKCVCANPWIKQYAGTAGFMSPVGKDHLPHDHDKDNTATSAKEGMDQHVSSNPDEAATASAATSLRSAKKRSADDAELDPESVDTKRAKNEEAESPNSAYHTLLPPAPSGTFSLFVKEDFRNYFCRCRDCYPRLSKLRQLLEEEDSYEPPLSEDGAEGGDGSVGTGSLLDRGEAALSNVDRVRAIGKCDVLDSFDELLSRY